MVLLITTTADSDGVDRFIPPPDVTITDKTTKIGDLQDQLDELNEEFKESYLLPKKKLMKQISNLKKELVEGLSPGESHNIGHFTVTIKESDVVKLTPEECANNGLNGDIVRRNTRSIKRVKWSTE